MAIVLDSSGSVSNANWELMENFTVGLINDVKIGPNNVRMAILMYADYVTIISNLDQHNSNSELLAVFNANSRTSGLTQTASAIQAVRLNVFGSTTRDVKKIGMYHVCLDRLIIFGRSFYLCFAYHLYSKGFTYCSKYHIDNMCIIIYVTVHLYKETICFLCIYTYYVKPSFIIIVL